MTVKGYCTNCEGIREIVYMDPWVECGVCSGRSIFRSKEDYEEYGDVAALPPNEDYWNIRNMKNRSISISDRRSTR